MASANQKRDLELLLRIERKDPEAQEELIRKYTPMVRHIVRRHYARAMDFEDLCQEGFIGLLQAIDQYDPTRYDVAFSSFAYLCIIRKVYNAIKSANGARNRPLNTAVSLQHAVQGQQDRTVQETIPSDEPDPLEQVDERLSAGRLQQVLAHHLSILEYTVAAFLAQGYSAQEIVREVGVNAKAVDNARTRVRAKLGRLLRQYGTLLNPTLPLAARRRTDLYVQLPQRHQAG
ncbi:sigma-70 family RNA polymerase sigma factor [Limnochorda pilosa]|uniref:RNA polymerase sigma factor SigS n=1 Tax=Limnochorda pilosa TaxID=1555112 RepID=A0A0K2SK45_LIMPI|nr:sigma-70 family RNA polymerase sigma factor [Limnochorda pilosa]BAS27470.1 RNA polymerase sigma 70 [Limnochorda pilosa]